MNPMVSVVMPAYNHGLYIERAVRSVLEQTWRDLELIIVDDGSTDNTVEIVERLLHEDSRINLICQANSGVPSITYNTGLNRANGRYVCFLDSDDFYSPDKVARCLEIMERYQHANLVFHDVVYVDKSGKVLADSYLQRSGLKSRARNSLTCVENNVFRCGHDIYFIISTGANATILPSSAFIRSSAFGQEARFSNELILSADLDLWLRLLSGGGRFIFIDEVLSFWRLHGGNLTATRHPIEWDRIRVHEMNYKRAKTIFSLTQRLVYRRFIANLYANGGFGLALIKDDRGASRSFLRSFRRSPNWFALKGYIIACLRASFHSNISKLPRLISGQSGGKLK
jgi:glycosyltransferase involved in cell wall biosynthesis